MSVCHECGGPAEIGLNYRATQYVWMAACIPCACRAVSTADSDDRAEIRPLKEEER